MSSFYLALTVRGFIFSMRLFGALCLMKAESRKWDASLLQNLYGQCNLPTLLIWENQDPCGSYYMTNICYERPSGTALTCSKICKLQHIEMYHHNVALQFAIMGSFIILRLAVMISLVLYLRLAIRAAVYEWNGGKPEGRGWKCHQNFLLC